jgi:hypothetical protein
VRLQMTTYGVGFALKLAVEVAVQADVNARVQASHKDDQQNEKTQPVPKR